MKTKKDDEVWLEAYIAAIKSSTHYIKEFSGIADKCLEQYKERFDIYYQEEQNEK
tara:strand:+ start:26178 stop:26342 length:165 start_codon:yes stop_codon:yes gene_type:complete